MFPYETIGILGSGSYGTVYKVKQQNNYYAIKRCDIYENAEEKQLCLGSLREFIFHQSIAHTGIEKELCSAFYYWKGVKHFYFVLPLFDCNLLQFAREYKQQHSISFDDFCILAKKLHYAVELLHLKGWIHRDIKPENIYLKRDGTLSLGDFNLVRFTDICLEESQEDFFMTIPRGSSSSLVCTLWTRPPELILSELQNINYVESGEEIDAFSVGATLLCLAFGNYVFGKHVRGDSENITIEYIQGYFSIIGTDSFIDDEFDFDLLQLEKEKLASFANCAERLQHFLPKQWTTTEKQQVSKILTSLLDPLPSRRGSIKLIQSLQTNEKELSQTSKQYISQAPCKPLSQHFLINPAPLPKIPLEPVTLTATDTLWSTCGQLRVPIPLALEAVYARRSLHQISPKYILYLLRHVHRYPSSINWNVSLETILLVLPYIRLRNDIWKFARIIEKEPFLICCFAAWLHVYGTVPSKESLVSSLEMNTILADNSIDCFFGSFGQRWKSQKEMLLSWRRLSFQETLEFEEE